MVPATAAYAWFEDISALEAFVRLVFSGVLAHFVARPLARRFEDSS